MRNFFLILGLAAIVRGQYDYGIGRRLLVMRQNSSLPLTGIHNPNGSMGIRQEIRDLEKDPVTWNLYLLGLDMMQYTNQAYLTSWYQIAGIHGRPYLPFDGVQAAPSDSQSGYCTHTSILFPTWHRPYLALYEQVLQRLILSIAGYYPEGVIRNQYLAAAADFRIPYWDWAMAPADGQSVLPASCQSPYVIVDGPNGPQEISNPLFSYIFHPLDPTDLPDAPFNTYRQTLRYPTTQNYTAVSQNGLVAQQLDNSATAIRSRLYNLLTNYPSYSQFSNEAWIPEPNLLNYDSIESIHDTIHGLVGNGGHMSIIEYAAFDPMFMLHHTMVDRAFALWQTLNPKSYVTPNLARMNTFTTSAGTVQDNQTPLTPFHDGETGFWTSSNVRSTGVFGYLYPETVNSTGKTTRQNVISAINSLYGSSNTNKRRDLDLNGNHHEWLANIRLKKHALNAPFFVHVFLGPFNPNPVSWSFEPSLVASHCVFLKSANVTEADDIYVSATIPLTSALLDNIASGLLRSLNPADVTDFLSKNFQYRLTTMNDAAVGNDKVPSLTISIVGAPVQLPANEDELPIWGNATSYVDITTGATVSFN